MRRSQSRPEILGSIEKMIDADNLAAVLIHLNDTYLIEERESSRIPGMARVAGLIHEIRELVRSKVKEDRTLVLHSGDYLGPSAMSQKFKGQQMVEQLNRCGVNFATLGNHEFDFGASELVQRLEESTFRTVLANVESPPEFSLERLVFWPATSPFLAIAGLAGEQTLLKAERNGFTRLDLEASLRGVLEEVRKEPAIGTMVVLSHMDRDEDVALQTRLSKHWHRNGFLYLLGGHDHDISWPQQDRRNCLLSKCMSNCRSVSVFLISKDGVAAPSPRVEISEEHVTTVEDVIDVYRNISPARMRADFQDAFIHQIQESYARHTKKDIEDYSSVGTLATLTIEQATEFGRPAFRAGCLEILNWNHLREWPLDPVTEEAVARWVRQMDQPDREQVVVDLRTDDAVPALLNATDRDLRWCSTDFGNFAADAVKDATCADVALINSGSFRLDGFVPARITVSDLRNVFLYDKNDTTVIVLNLPQEQVLSLVEHATTKAGQGAFLQISHSLEEIRQMTGKLRVGLIRHMLEDPEDGFQQALAKARGISPTNLLSEIEGVIVAHGSLVQLIQAGAVSVRYSKDARIEAQRPTSAYQGALTSLVRLTDRYRKACADAGIDPPRSLDLLEARANVASIQGFPFVKSARGDLRSFVCRIRFREAGDIDYLGLYKYAVHSREVHEHGIRYQDYLDRAGTLQ